MPEEVTLSLFAPEAIFFRSFLEGMIEQMKGQCTLKDAEDEGVKIAFAVIVKLINQLPKE